MYPFPLKILGVGCYLPDCVVTNKELMSKCEETLNFGKRKLGIQERRWVNDNEDGPFMGAKAAREALANAERELCDIDLIINASVSFERMSVDNAPLIKKELETEGTSIPCTTVKAGWQSFPVALDLCASLLATNRYRKILIVSSEVISPMLGEDFEEAYTLFGDGASAVVVEKAAKEENSCIHNAVFENFGIKNETADFSFGITNLYEETEKLKDAALKVNMDSLIQAGVEYLKGELKKIIKKYSLENIDLVIPQQLGKSFFSHLNTVFPEEKIIKITEQCGFCGAASYPIALYKAIEAKKLQRNDLLLIIGFDSGMTVGGLLLTF